MRRSLLLIGLLLILSCGMLTTSQSTIRNKYTVPGSFISPGLSYIPECVNKQDECYPIEVIQIVDEKGEIVAVKVISKK